MLDVHAVSSGGSLTLAEIGTIALGGDGASVAGLPLDPKATLMAWGGLTTIADTIKQLKMVSQDLDDPINGEDFNFGASSLLGSFVAFDNLPFMKGKRSIQMAQNTAAANNIGFTVDLYADQGKEKCMNGNEFDSRSVVVTQVFGGALTALTWKNQAVAPTNPLPAGKYMIHGAWVNALTNHALIRFQHPDFGPFMPGFPVVDAFNTAVANAVLPKNQFYLYNGNQFDFLSEQMGVPCNPVFNVGAGATGLNIQALSITADTPNVILNLSKIA